MADQLTENMRRFKAEKFSLLARKAELLEELEAINERLQLVRGAIQGLELGEAQRADNQ